jgi:hypothetical protein
MSNVHHSPTTSKARAIEQLKWATLERFMKRAYARPAIG